MKDKIERAYDALVGYCQKRTWCEQGCRFHVNDSCIFQEEIPPVDWDKIRRGELDERK